MDSVARALAAHCTDLEVPERPHVLELANVQHLATDVTGRLADRAPVLALAASLTTVSQYSSAASSIIHRLLLEYKSFQLEPAPMCAVVYQL